MFVLVTVGPPEICSHLSLNTLLLLHRATGYRLYFWQPVNVCRLHTADTKAAIVLQLATGHWVIKAEHEDKSDKGEETI